MYQGDRKGVSPTFCILSLPRKAGIAEKEWNNIMLDKFTELKSQLSVKRILVDGGILSGLIGTLIVTTMYYNAEIWYDDYPTDIKAKAGPMSQSAKRQRPFVAVPLVLLVLGMPIYSNLKLKRQNKGRLSFLPAFFNAYAVSAFFNLFDLLVLDYLFVIALQPDFVVLPGTEGMASYHDYFFPFVGFLKGLGYGLVPSLLIAFLTSRSWRKSDHVNSVKS